MKKITALLLAVVLVLGMLSGCQEKMTAQTLAEKMTEVGTAVTESSGKMSLEMVLNMSMTGFSMDYGVKLAADYAMINDPVACFVDATMTMEAMGTSESYDMQIYVGEENGETVMYDYDGATETWTRSVSDSVGEAKGMTNVVAIDLESLPAESLVLAEEKQTIGEREVYVLTATVTGDQMNEMMAGMMENMTAATDAETAALLEELDFSALTAVVNYYVDCENYQTLQMDMEIQGFGDVLNSLFATLMGEAMGVDAEEYGITMDITTLKASMTDLVYENVEVPTVPQEAIDAAAMNPLQEDGSYVLRLNDAAVRVVPPEGFEGYAMDSLNLTLYTEDYMTTVQVSLMEDFTAADLAEQASYMAEYYGEMTYGEVVNGFENVTFADDASMCIAWKELDGCVVLVDIYTDETMPDIPTVLNAIQDYEG